MKDISQIESYKCVFVEQVFVPLLFFFLTVWSQCEYIFKKISFLNSFVR